MDFISKRSEFQVQLHPFSALSPWTDHFTFHSPSFLAYAMKVSARWCTDPEENGTSGLSVKQMLVTSPPPEPTNSNTGWWPVLRLLSTPHLSVPLGHLRHRLRRHPSSLVLLLHFPFISVVFWPRRKDWPGCSASGRFPSSHSALGMSPSSRKTRSIRTQLCARLRRAPSPRAPRTQLADVPPLGRGVPRESLDRRCLWAHPSARGASSAAHFSPRGARGAARIPSAWDAGALALPPPPRRPP